MYTPGFAAPELYRRQPQLGPWTDIYSLGSTMYACMTGAPPQPADQRELDDRMPANIAKLRSHYSHPIVDVLDWCLKLNGMERPQSVFALQRALRNIVVQSDTLKAPTGGRWFDTIVDRFSGRRALAKANSKKLDPSKIKAAEKALKAETT
jgi:eukaryotic-like serine/threonine-protein kinase